MVEGDEKSSSYDVEAVERGFTGDPIDPCLLPTSVVLDLYGRACTCA